MHMYGQVSPIADMKTVKLLHLIFALLQYAGAQMVTDPNALPCGNDNLSCPGEDQCFNSSMLCDGERFCSVGTDEGMGVDSLNCSHSGTGTVSGPTFECTQEFDITQLCNGFADCMNGTDETTILCANKCRGPYRGGCEALHRECFSSVLDVSCKSCLPGFIDNPGDPGGECLPVITIGLESNSYTAVEGTPLEVCAAVEQGTFGLNSTELGNTTFDVNILTFNLYSYSYTNTDDYEDINTILVFSAGNLRQCVIIDIIDDDLVEFPEEFIIILSSNMVNVQLINHFQFIIIEDNDALFVGFEVKSTEVFEDEGAIEVCIDVTGSSEEVTYYLDLFRISLEISATPDTAGAADDYLFIDDIVEINTIHQCFIVGIIDDQLYEETEIFTITIVRVDNTQLSFPVIVSPDLLVISVVDNDFPTDGAVVTIIPSAVTVTENKGTASVRVVRVGDTTQALTLNFLTVPNSPAPGISTGDADYIPVSVNVTFDLGEVEQFVNISIIDDAIFEGTEMFIGMIQLLDGPSNVELQQNVVTITIVENDNVTIKFNETEYTVAEDAGNIAVTMEKIGDSDIAIDVALIAIPISATSEQDYSIVDQVVVFAPGDQQQEVIIDILEDSVTEGTESFQLRLYLTSDIILGEASGEQGIIFGEASGEQDIIFGEASGEQDIILREASGEQGIILREASGEQGIILGKPSTVFVSDNDAVTIQFDEGEYTVSEDAGMFVATVTKTGESEIPLEVTVDLIPIQAIDGITDFFLVSETLEIPPGGDQSLDVIVMIIEDEVVESTEDFSLVLNNQSGVVLGDISRATVHIMEDDVIVVGFNATSYTVVEDSGFVNLTIARRTPTTLNTVVNINTISGTAFSIIPECMGLDSFRHIDFDFVSAEISIPPSNSSTEAVGFQVGIINDAVTEERDEMFTVVLSSMLPGIVRVNRNAQLTTVTIQDDDILMVEFENATYVVNEGDGTFAVCLVKRGETVLDFDVDISVIETDLPRGAEDGVDYLKGNTTHLPFLSNAAIICIAIEIVDDDLALEGVEEFSLMFNVSDPRIQVGRNTTSTVMILDSDVVTVNFTSNTYSVAEGIGSVELCVEKDNKIVWPFVVKVVSPNASESSDGASGSGSLYPDFDLNTDVLDFTPGGDNTLCSVISAADDDMREGQETFIFKLEISNDAVRMGQPSIAMLSIIEVVVEFTAETYTVLENNETATVCLKTNFGIPDPLNVTLTAFTNTTANFSVAVEMLTFNSTSTGYILCTQVYIVNNDIALEGPKNISIEFDLPLNALVRKGSIASSTIIILDDDVVAVEFVNSSYVVNEADGSVEVCLRKVGAVQTAQDFDVNITAVETSPVQAEDGNDFTTTTSQLIFPANESSVCTRIDLVDDNVLELDEQFSLMFSVGHPDVEIGSTTTSTVTIIDDDESSVVAADGSTSDITIIGSVLGSVAGVLLILVVVAAVILVKFRKHVKLKHTTEITAPHALQLQQLQVPNGGGRYFGVAARRKLPQGSSAYIKPMTDAKLLIPGRHIHLLDSIGKGEFGMVYRAQLTGWEGMNEVVAVKTLRGGILTPRDVDDMMRESIKMKDFDHLNVLSLIGVSIDAGESPYIVMPYMANGSLLSYLKKERPNLTIAVGSDEDMVIDARKRLLSMCLQIAKGMEYLAAQKVVHRDLAARNCMIDNNFVIKVADFGLSESMHARDYFREHKEEGNTVKLPVKWMAFESFVDGIFTEKTDVWAFGVTCWEVFSLGRSPYPGIDPFALVKALENGMRLDKPSNEACSQEIFDDILYHCWEQQPEDRPTFSELVYSVSFALEGIAGYMDFSFVVANEDATEKVEEI